MTNLIRTIKLTEAQWAVLGLLSLGECSGYDLSKQAEHNVNLILAPTKSRIYAVLPELLARGYVSRREVSQRGRPDKQLYRLTRSGRKAFEEWLNDTTPPVKREPLLLKLFFGTQADAEALLEQVREFRRGKDEELAVLARHDQVNLADPSDVGFFRTVTVACGLELARVQIKWADRTARALDARIREGSGRRVAAKNFRSR